MIGNSKKKKKKLRLFVPEQTTLDVELWTFLFFTDVFKFVQVIHMIFAGFFAGILRERLVFSGTVAEIEMGKNAFEKKISGR